jgi:hypothetical protein
MKYSCEIVIHRPVTEVISKLDSPQNLKHWQAGLVATEHISGTPGEFGAKMKMKYRFGKREMELTETIIKRAFPEEFHAAYTTKGMRNIQKNYFRPTKKGHTKWISESEFQPTSLRMRALLFLMPSAFKKQSFRYMSDFKSFVEEGKSVHNAQT